MKKKSIMKKQKLNKDKQKRQKIQFLRKIYRRILIDLMLNFQKLKK